MTARGRITREAACVHLQGQSIDWAFAPPFNCEIVEVFFQLGELAAASANQAFLLQKLVQGAALTLWRIDPFEEGGLSFNVGQTWEVKQNEVVEFQFANVDDVDAKFQIVFKEVD